MQPIERALLSINAVPAAQALRLAVTHQATDQALLNLSSIGISEGVCQFKPREAADAKVQAGVGWVIAQNVRVGSLANERFNALV